MTVRSFWSLVIRGYQWCRRGRPPQCRFLPSCSEYTRQAMTRYGCWKGGALGLWRLLHCHPWYPGGYDPVS